MDILEACRTGHADTVALLLAREDCDPNVKDCDGNTPLIVAVDTGFSKIAQLLLSIPNCDATVANKHGETPLHVACRKRSAKLIKTLLGTGKCDVNVQQTNTGDTPLHLALRIKGVTVTGKRVKTTSYSLPRIDTRTEDTEIIQLLLADPQCDPNVTNNRGETPLQIACQRRKALFVKTLLQTGKWNPNVQSNTGDTPLHLATQIEDREIIQLLLADPQSNPHVPNKQGETPLHIAFKLDNNNIFIHILERGCHETYANRDQMLIEASSIVHQFRGDSLLHMACEVGSTTVIGQLLLADPQCDPNVTNNRGETPLHVACKKGNALLVVKALLQTGKCDFNAQTNTGDTPLHLAIQLEDTEVIQLLLADPQCGPNVTNNRGETPLHVACKKGNALLVVKVLFQTGKCDFNAQTNTGDTPLHLATQMEDTEVIQLLLADPQCDPNVTNKQGETPLHDACRKRKAIVVKTLLESGKCGTEISDLDGNTPLSIACQLNAIESVTLNRVEVVSLLLSSGVDPECVNNAGKTPAELATDYRIIQKISSLTEARHKHPIETFVKIFIIGNAETGKSTLIEAICTEASIIHKFISKRVKNVEPHTAGIIPRRFQSKHFGNAVLYDFAGQCEYYSSHAAVMENVAVPTPPAFVVVFDISEPIGQITEKVTYWWSFIENHCKRTSVPPPVILVGSHEDVIKARGEKVKERMKQVLQSLGGIPTTFHFASHIAIDCRSLVSKGLNTLLSLLNESCKSLRKTTDVDFRCHVLYAFLTDIFQSSTACKVSQVVTSIKKEKNGLLPQKPAELERLLSTLSDKGQVLLLKNTSNPEDSWILLKKEKLLAEVNGSIFAPDIFRQSIQGFARSTGVVPRSKIQQQFPQYPLDIVIGLLSHLEFCFKIEDYQALDMIAGEWEPQSPTSPSDKDEEFYFFPALVRVEYPINVWKQDQAAMETQKPPDLSTTFQCGWFYQCSLSNQFLTSRFLHVLILRQAFKFALAVDRHSDQSPVIRRRCSAWKHGIAWLNRDGIETVVEVGLQCRWVTVMMHCSTNQIMECVQLQSSVIKTILDTKADFCPAVAMVQSLIHPDCLQYQMEEKIRGGIVQYSFKEVAEAVIKGKPYTIDQSGTEKIEIKTLLPFEPYLGLGEGVISKLFSSEYAGREVTDNYLTELAEKAHERVELFQQVLKPILNPSLFHDCCRQNTDNPISQCKSLLKLFRDQGNGTFQDFELHLSKYSIFSGQNPLELAGMVQTQCPTASTNEASAMPVTSTTTSTSVIPSPPSDQDTRMGDCPTMPELVRLKVSQEISTNWYYVGILLLEDKTGARIKSIDETCRGNPKRINDEVLQQWIEGKGKMPVTWRTLVDVLRDAELTNLAADIEANVSN